MKFSIVTITFNRARLIAETIESVLNQTYQNFEHIIIDDGSTDNTEEVVKSFNDERIKYYKQKKHFNRSFLRNLGIQKSTGDIICILDSDDIWCNKKLETLFEIFNFNTEIVFIIHNVLKKGGHKLGNSLIYNFKEDFFKNVLNEMLSNKILPYPFYSFKKSILKFINKYDENMIDGQHDFFLRIASNYPIYFSEKTLAYKREHDRNLSQKHRVSALLNYNISINKLLNSNKITKLEHKNISIKNNYKIAIVYFKNKEREKCLYYLNDVIKQTPFFHKLHLKTIIYKCWLFTKQLLK